MYKLPIFSSRFLSHLPSVRCRKLWHRPALEVDQTLIDSVEGWEDLPMESEETLEDLQAGSGTGAVAWGARDRSWYAETV